MSKRPVALFFADSHLDLQAWANRPRVYGDSMAAFEHIVNRACELEVSSIIGAGDLIDVKHPPARVADFIRRSLDNAKACDITFAFIQGQHEMSRDVPWFSAMHEDSVHLDEALLYLSNDMPVYGLDWRPASQVRAAIDGIPAETKILVMHQVWQQFMGSVCNTECSLVDLPSDIVLVTGDYHYNIDDRYGVANGFIRAISPGSTNLRAINEPDTKYLYLLYDDDSLAHESIPTRRRLTLSCSGLDGVAELDGQWTQLYQSAMDTTVGYPEHLRYPLLQFRYPADIPQLFVELERIVAGRAEIFRKELPPADAVCVEVSKYDRDKAVSAGLVGCLGLLVEPDSRDYSVLSELLTSFEPEEVLRRLREERGLKDEAEQTDAH